MPWPGQVGEAHGGGEGEEGGDDHLQNLPLRV
jgi:hypothetical protein